MGVIIQQFEFSFKEALFQLNLDTWTYIYEAKEEERETTGASFGAFGASYRSPSQLIKMTTFANCCSYLGRSTRFLYISFVPFNS